MNKTRTTKLTSPPINQQSDLCIFSNEGFDFYRNKITMSCEDNMSEND